MVQTILQYLNISNDQAAKGFIYNPKMDTLAISLDETKHLLINKVGTEKPSIDGNFRGELYCVPNFSTLYVWNENEWIDINGTNQQKWATIE